MGCGTSSAVKIEISSFEITPSPTTEFVISDLSVVSGVYKIQSGALSHKLVLYSDGKVVIDGKFGQSIIYKQGRKEFTFKMERGCSLTHGEVRFTDLRNVNGVFYSTDHSSYVIQGTIDEDADLNGVKAEGKDSVVIDQLTLKRYKELEARLEKYNSGTDMYSEVLEMTEKARAMEQRIKMKVEKIEDMKEKLKHTIVQYGADSTEAKELEIELESKCLALAVDQQEYDNTLKYIKNSTADLFDYNILSEEFDELLHAMFGGDNGSEIENQLEVQVDQLEAAKRQHSQSYDRDERIWTEAKNCCAVVLQALNTWSSLQRADNIEEKKRLFLAKQTRSMLVMLVEGLANIELLLQDVPSFAPDVECREKGIEFRSNIYEMYSTAEGVEQGIDILMFCKTRTRTLEQWVFDNFKLKRKHQEAEGLNTEMLAAKLKLKEERRGLISTWLTEHVGELEREESAVSGGVAGSLTGDCLDHNEDPLGEVMPFDIETTYEQIVADMKSREQRAELDGIRAELELQDKIRARRKRQRHLNRQKLLESDTQN